MGESNPVVSAYTLVVKEGSLAPSPNGARLPSLEPNGASLPSLEGKLAPSSCTRKEGGGKQFWPQGGQTSPILPIFVSKWRIFSAILNLFFFLSDCRQTGLWT